MNASIEYNSLIQRTAILISYWLLLFSNILSIACSILLLTLLIYDRNLRRALHNHLIIIILFVNLASQLIDNSSYLSFLDHRRVLPSTPAMCIVWILVAYQFYVTSTLIVALASVQRHILIFYHRQCLSTSRRRFFVHYLPIVFLLAYSFTYGLTVTILLIKDNYPFDFSFRMCGGLSKWILNYPSLSIYDLLLHGLLPTPVITVASIGLLVRVVRQKRRLLGRIEWQKQRKMTIQLLSVSCLFIVINLPPIFLQILIITGLGNDLVGLIEASWILGYLTYYQSILIPFVCLFPLLSSLRTTWKKIFRSPVHLLNRHTAKVTPLPT